MAAGRHQLFWIDTYYLLKQQYLGRDDVKIQSSRKRGRVDTRDDR